MQYFGKKYMYVLMVYPMIPLHLFNYLPDRKQTVFLHKAQYNSAQTNITLLDYKLHVLKLNEIDGKTVFYLSLCRRCQFLKARLLNLFFVALLTQLQQFYKHIHLRYVRGNNNNDMERTPKQGHTKTPLQA